MMKQVVYDRVAAMLAASGITVASADFDRPWGGFFVVDDSSTSRFIAQFFPEHSYEALAKGLALTPKILVVAPGKRLSWQYHDRREEIWRVIEGPVNVITSDTDIPGPAQLADAGVIVSFGIKVRHRLVGLEDYGIVAEFWKHTDPNNPSNEDDIVRVEDDFSR